MRLLCVVAAMVCENRAESKGRIRRGPGRTTAAAPWGWGHRGAFYEQLISLAKKAIWNDVPDNIVRVPWLHMRDRQASVLATDLYLSEYSKTPQV